MKKIIILPILIICLIIVIFTVKLKYRSSIECNLSAAGQTELETALPENQGMNPEVLNSLDESIKKNHPYMKSFLILRNGFIVFEKYYQDHDFNTHFQITSATKLVTAMLVGIALMQGYLKDIHQKAADYYPELITEQADKLFKEIGINHLLSMTDGIRWNEAKDPYSLKVRLNYIKHAFTEPIINNPGSTNLPGAAIHGFFLLHKWAL